MRTAERIAEAQALARYLDSAEFLVPSGDSVRAYAPPPRLSEWEPSEGPITPSDRSKTFTKAVVDIVTGREFDPPLARDVEVIICEGLIIHAAKGPFYMQGLVGVEAPR